MSSTPDQSALIAAIRHLLQPVVRLAMAHGVTHPALDELLRTCFVDEACKLHCHVNAHGIVSRVSMSTGLSRREASRLLCADPAAPRAQRWLAGELLTKWRSDPQYAPDGNALPLPRSGSAPSFEALAQSITRDVHPRSLLDELQRLQLVRWNDDHNRIELPGNAFVPSADLGRMTALLADNVGDHLNAAVDNVLGNGREHFEQAIYADELSHQSAQALKPLISAHWATLFSSLVPHLEQLIASDEQAARTQDQRVRVGFYTYTTPMQVDG